MSDELFYLRATKETEGENLDLGLWSKTMALCEGDEHKAKYQYINLRVEQLKAEAEQRRLEEIEKQKQAELTKLREEENRRLEEVKRRKEFFDKHRDEFDAAIRTARAGVRPQNCPDGYVTINELWRSTMLSTDQILRKIRSGELDAQVVNGYLFIRKDDSNLMTKSVDATSPAKRDQLHLEDEKRLEKLRNQKFSEVSGLNATNCHTSPVSYSEREVIVKHRGMSKGKRIGLGFLAAVIGHFGLFIAFGAAGVVPSAGFSALVNLIVFGTTYFITGKAGTHNRKDNHYQPA